jgi:hypothetical protein
VTKNKRRRCLHCRHLFHRDPRTPTQQRFCPAPACRAASKKASQQRWLRKAENQDYFCGAQHVNRVRAWRAKRREYGQESALSAEPLQEMIMAHSIDLIGKYGSLPLQETIRPEVRESVEETSAGSLWRGDEQRATGSRSCMHQNCWLPRRRH